MVSERHQALLLTMRQFQQSTRPADPAPSGPITPPWELKVDDDYDRAVAFMDPRDFRTLKLRGAVHDAFIAGYGTVTSAGPDVPLFLHPHKPRAVTPGLRKFTREDFLVDDVVLPLPAEGAIRGFFGPYRCLSNFHRHPVTIDGITFPDGEAAYHALKTDDPELKKKFCDMPGAYALRFGQKLNLAPDWDEVQRYHAMYRVQLAKYLQDEASRNVLLGTGDLYLEETNWWEDDFWGACTAEGQNHLGRILMAVREALRAIFDQPGVLATA